MEDKFNVWSFIDFDFIVFVLFFYNIRFVDLINKIRADYGLNSTVFILFLHCINWAIIIRYTA